MRDKIIVELNREMALDIINCRTYHMSRIMGTRYVNACASIPLNFEENEDELSKGPHKVALTPAQIQCLYFIDDEEIGPILSIHNLHFITSNMHEQLGKGPLRPDLPKQGQ